jgi:hypothetical protein
MMKPCRMIAALVATLLVLAGAGCGASAATTTSATSATPAQTIATADEYDIYSALISGYSNPLIIIEDTTANPDSGLFVPGDAVNTMKGQWPQLGKDILRDFEQKNENPSLLQRRFTLGAKYVLVSRREIESIFLNNGDGWDDFYTKYPGSQGILTLSRVGFNEAKDTAVLYSGSQSNWLNGHGSMVLMKKVAGRWTVLDGATMWVS